jgi:purine-binding chemotaxis protein CheW
MRVVKVLTFYLGEEKYGVEIEHIVTVEKNERANTKIPNGSEIVKEVVNVRSKIIPVIDLNRLFTGVESRDTHKKKLIIFEKELNAGAILVDDTGNIIDITDDQVEKIDRDGKNVRIVNLETEAFVIVGLDELIDRCKL